MSMRIRAKRDKPPGETGFLSTAGSLDLSVGPRVGRPGEAGGYYIDFRSKATDPTVPPPWLPPAERQIHCETAQWGLGCLERHQLGDGNAWLDAAIWAGRHLLSLQRESGEWRHGCPMPHTYRLDPPWLSALAQGEGASLLARLHVAIGGDELAAAAAAALEPMRRPSAEGGAMALLDGAPIPEEYPTDPPSFVLNGAIFALWGYRDVALLLGDERAGADFERGVDALAANIHRWDTGWWSLYDLFPHHVRNVASPAYHALHITQLDAMQRVEPRPELGAARDRFVAYAEGRSGELRAFAAKAAFRLLVPRNAWLARRMPSSHASHR